jgi:ribosomal protein RSM22 (predicted rRNA methylase)
MQLPPSLHRTVEELLAAQDLRALDRAAAELSQRYRAGRIDGGRPVSSLAHRAAYAAFRLPATFAAAHKVLAETARLMPQSHFASLLDLGAGPGTVSWAAVDVFESLDTVILGERDPEWLTLGQKLAHSSPSPALAQAHWQRVDLRDPAPLPTSDLVVAGYSLGELTDNDAAAVLDRAWQAAVTALVVIEPGTPAGWSRIRALRQQLIDGGAHVVAPCPHGDTCPLAADDWCHFSARVERTALHRRLKAASLGHEDEKFSYIVAAKEPVSPAGARVVRHPQKRSGHTNVSLCTKEGLETRTLSRRDKPRWKRAAKLSWGDAWDE